MNGKRNRVLSAMLGVLVASFVLVGGVAADHGTAPVHADVSTRVRYAQYQEALANQGQAATMVGRVPASEVTRVRFEQYREAISSMEISGAATSESEGGTDSATSFGQYLSALEQMERSFQAALFTE